MSIEIYGLKEKRAFCLRTIESIESNIESYKCSENAIKDELLEKRIDFHKHCLGTCKTELQHIESQLAALDN